MTNMKTITMIMTMVSSDVLKISNLSAGMILSNMDCAVKVRHYYERCNRALSGSTSPACEDQWAKYSGENVGWRFDSDTRWAKGKLQDRWNPIREDKESAAP